MQGKKVRREGCHPKRGKEKKIVILIFPPDGEGKKPLEEKKKNKDGAQHLQKYFLRGFVYGGETEGKRKLQ